LKPNPCFVVKTETLQTNIWFLIGLISRWRPATNPDVANNPDQNC